jgi:hypothetical protein
MPTQQSLGFDEEPMEPHSGEHSAESGQYRTVWWPQRRTCNLAPKNRHFVSQDDDLDGQIGVFRPSETEELQRPDEGEIKK